MKRGTVLFHRDFIFKDGESGEKYLIILNDPSGDEPYLCCKTTSKSKYDITQEGCHPHKNIYLLKAKKDCFPYNTWIQFHELYELTAEELLKAHLGDKTCNITYTLKNETCRAIRNCIKKSIDISPYHLELLFKN